MSVGQYLCPALKLEGGSPMDHQGEGSILGGQVWGVPHHLTVQILVGVYCPFKQNQTWMKSCSFYRHTVNDVMKKNLHLYKNWFKFCCSGIAALYQMLPHWLILLPYWKGGKHHFYNSKDMSYSPLQIIQN